MVATKAANQCSASNRRPAGQSDGAVNLSAVFATGRAEFACILVYDASRWGRFQDSDEGFTRENIARLEQEMEMLQRDFKAVEAGCGQNVLHLTLDRAYIRKLVDNGKVARFL